MIVVNLIEVLILLFYFLASSNSFWMFLTAIFREFDSVGLDLISLADMNFVFCGSSSRILDSRTIYF